MTLAANVTFLLTDADVRMLVREKNTLFLLFWGGLEKDRKHT